VDAFLNAAFFVFHTAWIALTSLGWLWRRARRWQLAAVAFTAASWFGLGFWYGWGYCPFTDWHYRVRERLGYDDPPSYVQLLIRSVTGLDLATEWANAVAVVVLVVAALLGVVLTLRDRRRITA
jgi:hypothetical protein